MMVPWDIYLPGPSAHRFYGAGWQFSDIFSFIHNHSDTLDAHDKLFGNVPDHGMSLVHTGVHGDGGRWRLPSDSPPTRGEDLPGVSGVAGCAWHCEQGNATCLGMFVSGSGHCYLLAELQLIRGTVLAGDSFVRNATVPAAPPPYSCDVLSVELVGRQGSGRSGFSRAIHISDWRYVDGSGVWSPPVNISVDNTILQRNSTWQCPAFATVQLAAFNDTLRPIAGRPSQTGSRTVFTVPSPRPWSFLLLTYPECPP